MNKKTHPAQNSLDFPPAPIFYADQPSALMLGPAVSRISFGVEEEDGGDFPRPVVTIAMPTVALLAFVNDLKAAFESSDFKKEAVDHLAQTARKIASGGGTTAPDKKISRVIARK